MRPTSVTALALLLAAGATPMCAAAGQAAGVTRGAAASQAPCAVTPVVVDSARDEILAVLTSGGPVIQEIRQEQGITKPEDLAPVTVIRDGTICARLRGQFGHELTRGATFVVLRVGPLYYAREPDQRRATGILTDSTFRVVARLGAAIR